MDEDAHVYGHALPLEHVEQFPHKLESSFGVAPQVAGEAHLNNTYM
jgi:hypothetical protein